MEESSSLTSNLNYNVSLKMKLLLISLLLLLNIVIRIPSVPHEQGYDSFFIHGLANSITNFGEAQWWGSWLSIFGLYPYSYASSVPFSLSGISQLTGIPMEFTILIFCIFLGIFTIFASYLFAGVFHKSFISRYIFSYLFSLSASTMTLTTWQITTRAQFLVFFPFFMYQLYKALKGEKKFSLLLIITFLFVFATHHYAYFLIFFSALIVITFLFYKLGSKIQIPDIKYLNLNNLYFAIAFFLIITPFLFSGQIGLIEYGSRYSWIISIVITSIRNLGPVFPLSIGGFVYISFKKFKSYQEWSILACILPTIVFSYNQTYGYLITYLLFIILGAEGIINLVRSYRKDRELVLYFIVLILIVNITFSGFFAHWKLGTQGGYTDWYMTEESYLTGQWMKNNLNPDIIGISNGFETDRMYASYGGIPPLYSRSSIWNYINGFITFNKSDLCKTPIFSKNYYFEGVYFLEDNTDSAGLLSWLSEFPVTDMRVEGFLNKLNVSFFIEDGYVPSTFTNSLSYNKNKIYDGGRMRLWLI
ncbi:hypothetical protein MSMTP_2495 [Methanosarcina sp. MTP4]|uniref:hypothetical protein n=1 Tax=Methanosarcina sp. MTP4 TaxID=1434100 RepID=UPI000615AA70|nr:hypothetical protein [Methanosarcina sp. MTP4]AKB25964.1 hypothetical protein MSMTP_2495 [Methanosarcina sp. MTP4]